MTQIRRGLPPLPDRIKTLPLDSRGYPIPWFVHTAADGTRDFRIADGGKRALAARQHLCWICGQPMGKFLAFVIGPMCAVNRNTSEPANHRDCAMFAATACPFLVRPKAEYRDSNLPEGIKEHPGSVPGNPGACCIWITETFQPYRIGRSDWLIRLGDPIEVLWYCEGKSATREQIESSLAARLPILRDMAKQGGPDQELQLAAQIAVTMTLLPPL